MLGILIQLATHVITAFTLALLHVFDANMVLYILVQACGVWLTRTHPRAL
jgi:hypothetical protein